MKIRICDRCGKKLADVSYKVKSCYRDDELKKTDKKGWSDYRKIDLCDSCSEELMEIAEKAVEPEDMNDVEF